MQVRLLRDDDGALHESLAMNRPDVGRTAGKPQESMDLAEPGHTELGGEIAWKVCCGDTVVARQPYEVAFFISLLTTGKQACRCRVRWLAKDLFFHRGYLDRLLSKNAASARFDVLSV